MGLKTDKWGFTLVELIVVIAIMGIILVLALPQVSKIQDANKVRKYEAYKDSFASAAKIYIDNHKKDLFGNKETGCVTITYSDLKQDNLIKDFSEKGVDCNYKDGTKVDVTKHYDQYSYITDITCTKDGKEVYKKTDTSDASAVSCGPKDPDSGVDPNPEDPGGKPDNNPDGGCEPGEDGCTEGCTSGGCPNPEDTPPDLYVRPTSSKEKWYNSKGIQEELKLKYYVYDSNGLNKNISVQAKWTNKDTGATSTYVHDFKNKASKSTKKISVTVSEKKVPLETGHYSIVLAPNSNSASYGVQDFLGNVRYTPSRTYAEYWIDNTAPTMDPVITSKDSNYNSLNTKITLGASDDVKVDQMYISNTGYDTGGKWQSYQDSFDWKLDGSYDGKERIIYITVKDLAGNIIQKELTYTVYQNCTEVVDTGDWTDTSGCSKTCGGGVKTQQINQKDKHTSASCGTRSQSGVACNTGPCCSEANPKGCTAKYPCRSQSPSQFVPGHTQLHNTPSLSSPQNITVLANTKLYVITVSGDFSLVYMDEAYDFSTENRYWTGVNNNRRYGWIKSTCLADAPVGNGTFCPYEVCKG